MSDVLNLFIDRMDTPIGELLLVADERGRVRAVDWTDHEQRMLRLLHLHYSSNEFKIEPAHNSHSLKHAMEAYFADDVNAIVDLPVETAGTPFQRMVWNELRSIPVGASVSYRKVAEQIGRPMAVRAVGLANGANPIGIVVPCHRVIGSNGSLTGYGGGLERKRWLLDHERRHLTTYDDGQTIDPKFLGQ
ncbi:MAG: methylated-DNA--[protein]-cysteine S-methyltransferase [Bryobacteraceae bacterium]